MTKGSSASKLVYLLAAAATVFVAFTMVMVIVSMFSRGKPFMAAGMACLMALAAWVIRSDIKLVGRWVFTGQLDEEDLSRSDDDDLL